MNQKKLCLRIRNIIHKLKEKKDQHINLKQEQPTQVNGLEDLEMVLAYKSGLMELDMKVNGKITELMAMEGLCILMEMFMKEIG